jgi:hypothetical protein
VEPPTGGATWRPFAGVSIVRYINKYERLTAGYRGIESQVISEPEVMAIRSIVGVIGNVASFFRDRQLISAGEAKASAKLSQEQTAHVARANRARVYFSDTGVRESDFRD